MASRTKVYIDPATDMLYASYYIKGLYEVFGSNKVFFRSHYFSEFKHNNHCFAFVVVDESGREKKVVIDFTDSAIIDLKALEWSHVYGKINDDGKNKSPKIKNIPPSFGIQLYSGLKTLTVAGLNLLRAFSRIPDKRRFLSDYKSQYKRPKIEEYKTNKQKNNYVFFMASLWKSENETNTFRANFIKACKANSQINFEGGFAPRSKNDIKGYEALTVTSRIKMSEYLDKILGSLFVFNTPAVKDCHGWKLGEYLCMGSAIISTPLKRKLPAELKDKEHLLFSDGSITDLQMKINKIVQDHHFRTKLEKNAEEYFSTHCQPKKVIKYLLQNV